MKKWASVLTVLGMCVVGCGGQAPSTEQAAEEGAAPGASAPAGAAAASTSTPRYREIALPEGTSLPLRLQTAVASDTSKVEDAVRAELREAVVWMA